MSCRSCGQSRVMTATIANADVMSDGLVGCRVCSVTRLALLWIIGAGTIGTALVYWFFGPFTGCAC